MDERRTDQPDGTGLNPDDSGQERTTIDPVPASEYEQQGQGGGMKPAVVAALCAVLVLITALISANVWRDDAKWVAKVNGEKVTQAELYDEMYASTGQNTLQDLLTRKLIVQEGQAQNVSVSEEELQERLDELITREFGSEAQFEQLLTAYGLSRADFEEQIHQQMIVEKILETKVDIEDEELTAFFEANRESLGTPATAEVRHILTETRAEAEAVREEIQGGADFAAVAKEQSTDQTTASQGGELGSVSYNEGLPSWLLAAFELTPGELSEVIESENGFHVMETTSLTPAIEPVFEDVRDDVYQMVLEEKMMALYPEWIDNLFQSAEIEYRD